MRPGLDSSFQCFKPAGPASLANGAVWTESRKELELAIQAEKAKDHADWNPDLQSEEQRLRKRLSKLNLEMKIMIGDGNCLVSTLHLQICPEQILCEDRSVQSRAEFSLQAFAYRALLQLQAIDMSCKST